MNDQSRGRNCAKRKQGADRFKDNLVFRLKKRVVGAGFEKFQSLFARRCFIAQRVQYLDLGFHSIILFHRSSRAQKIFTA